MSREPKNTQKPAKNCKPDTNAGYNEKSEIDVRATVLNRSVRHELNIHRENRDTMEHRDLESVFSRAD
jgi:hypothetical protein